MFVRTDDCLINTDFVVRIEEFHNAVCYGVCFYMSDGKKHISKNKDCNNLDYLTMKFIPASFEQLGVIAYRPITKNDRWQVYQEQIIGFYFDPNKSVDAVLPVFVDGVPGDESRYAIICNNGRCIEPFENAHDSVQDFLKHIGADDA